ncbi:MAG TPA: integrase arm-type DNA-binding domain-containing protein [Stellaceae bacterium]|nr:integrase arm-type DNA-binding domain-containing protein [Stellaceae bacterium]
MPHARLTDATIRALKPPAAGQIDYWDETPGFKGFGLRLSQGGSRTFILLHGANRTRTTLGRYPVLSLAKAREKAVIILAERTLGIEPASPTIAFGDALTLFFTAHCDVMNRERTAYETKRLLNRHFKPEFERKQLSDIKTARIAELLDAIKGDTERRHAFAALRSLFRFAARRGLLLSSPCERLQMPGGKAPSRERVLSDSELVAVWRAAEAMGYPFGTIVHLLILTGQRRSEVGSLRSEWIGNDRIEFPAAIMKAKKPHTIPLTPIVSTILATISVEEGYLFPARRRGDRATGERAFNGWSKDKAILQTRIDTPVLQWGLHDLRRTASTRWAELGVPPHINDMLLAHTMQGVSAVHRVYNLATYLEPMRHAMQKWEEHLQALLSKPERANGGRDIRDVRTARARPAGRRARSDLHATAGT